MSARSLSQPGPRKQASRGRNGIGFEEREQIEQKTEELILLTGSSEPRRWRQRKGEYMHKLERDNADLESLIVQLQQQIKARTAQNDVLKDQLNYFQTCLAQGPLMVQPSERE